jgi:hypothetical protein
MRAFGASAGRPAGSRGRGAGREGEGGEEGCCCCCCWALLSSRRWWWWWWWWWWWLWVVFFWGGARGVYFGRGGRLRRFTRRQRMTAAKKLRHARGRRGTAYLGLREPRRDVSDTQVPLTIGVRGGGGVAGALAGRVRRGEVFGRNGEERAGSTPAPGSSGASSTTTAAAAAARGDRQRLAQPQGCEAQHRPGAPRGGILGCFFERPLSFFSPCVVLSGSLVSLERWCGGSGGCWELS